MKLHLPLSLRKCLLALMPAVLSVTCGTANAGVMHPDVTFQTYTDYGQNLGRYAVGTKVNALLQYIRTDVDKGILIHYTDGEPYFTISNEQGLIDVSGVDDIGAQNAISPTFAATVLHNGSISASYGERIVGIGSEHALNYASIDIRGSNVFRLAPYHTGTMVQYDYMLQRQSKVQTDVNWIPVTSVTDYHDYVGGYIYHIGAGGKGIWNTETNSEVSLAGAYSYIIGGINEIQSLPVHDTTGNLSVNQNPNYAQGKGADLTNPLPNAIRGGDSGSPVFIFNPESGKYEYIAAQQSGGGTYGQARGSVKWTHETLESFNARIDMSEDSVVYLDAVTDMTDSHADNSGNKAEVYTGHVLDEDGNILGDYNALKNGLNTWADLSGLKDTQNWYAYDAKAYLQRSITELFFNQNLVFTPTQEENRVILRDTVDLGVGYVEFNKGAGDRSVFIIESEEGESNLLNSAGYVINEGAEAHISFTNPDDHMYEWRKTGKGDLYIEGTGNSNALLNVGGTGKTYLKRQGGYAAYNVLLNTGATVVIDNVAQIQRDLTIGSGGGTLDLNGNSMEWYNTQDADDRFTINALTEQAVLANCGSKAAVLTYKESGDQTYAGSFLDSESGSLTIDYQGGGTWVLNSIHTDLSHHADSGLVVTNGKVEFNGTLTVHGMGSVNGRQPTRLVKKNDWHYADAKMNVTVKDDACFELGSHARLTGDVTVENGATYIMREGVKDRYEYVEGGALLEDTYIYRDFYGHKGNVNLEGNMLVQYSEGTTARNIYSGDISGSGALTINLGTDGAILELAGDNSAHTGLKSLVSGGLVATNVESLGNTEKHKWLVGSQAWIASQTESGAELLAKISENSTGTLALSNNTESELDLRAHTGLFIGAEEGKTVQYGTADKALTAVNKVWNLGGGGGELVVNFLLSGDNSLVLGADDSATGVVTLTNTTNSFTGGVTFNSTGIILNAVDGALGQSKVDLIYGNAFALPSADAVANIKAGSDGIVLVDELPAANIDLTSMPELAVGASGSNVTYSGQLTLAEGAVYRFSSVAGGMLNVAAELASEHSILIDAQGLAGGIVTLSGNDSFAGNITVQGHKEHNGTGEITMALGRDMSISGTIDLMQGGILDLSGHSLEVQHLNGANGKVVNSAIGGELVFNAANGDLAVDTALQLTTARKIGSGALTLSGNNALGVFYVDSGALILGGDRAVGNESVIYLADGAELRGNGHAHYGNVCVVAGEGTLSQASGGTTVLGGRIYAEEGAVLTLAGGRSGANAGIVKLLGAEHGTEGGTIRMDGVKLILESNEAISLNGTVAVASNSTLYSEGKESDMERNINDLRIENGAILTVDEHHWSTIWNIDKLSGEGILHWNSNTTHFTPSVLKLNGEGDFVGSIQLNRIFDKEKRKYGAFIELLSDNVAQHAYINLTGNSANSVASLVIKTDNAHIKGLSGNEHALVYAGDSLTDTPEDSPAVPTTTRKATITIDTAGRDYSYAGAVGHAVESADLGLSIVKLGAGTQAFTGTTVVNDVTVQEGALQFATDTTTLRGDINLSTGATLSGINYELGADKSFVVEYGADASASFSGNLTLGGGLFSLDAYVMTGGHPVLNINGAITMAENCNSQTITVQNIGALGVGSYTLASGDWSSVGAGTLQLQAGSIYDTSLDIVDGILKLNVALKQGTVVWDGSESVHEWSNSMFGSTEQALGTGAIALFNDTAAGKTVTVKDNVAVSQAVFATMGAYTVQGQDGAVATLSSLTKAGAGELVLESGVVVSGATAIEDGSLVIKKTGMLQGNVSGAGELVIDWGEGTGGSLSIIDLATLHIASGSYGAKNSRVIGVKYIIVDAGARYIQGDNVTQTATIVSNGGVLELAGGGIAGTLELTADTELYIRSGDVNLDSTLIHHGHAITQTFSGTGNGIMHIDGDSKMVLGQYVVAQGTLSFDDNRIHRGHGSITVEDGATLLVAKQSALEAESIILNGGGKLLLRNGDGTHSYVTSNITVSDGAIISGSLNGNSTQLNGTISGSGSLKFNTADNEGRNLYTVNSVISDASAETPLSLLFNNSYVVLTGANTYSGGTTINSGRVTVNNAMGLGSGAVQLNGGALVINTPGHLAAITGIGGELQLNNGTYRAQSLNLIGTSVSGSGSLVVSSGGQSVLGSGISLASLSVEQGASLTLGGSVCLDTAILNSGSVVLNEGIVFDLELTKGDNGVFTLISGTGDIMYGFDAFTVNNFMLQGSQLSDEIGWKVNSTDNTLQVTLTGLVRNRVWTGATSAVWDSATQNWATEAGDAAFFLVYDKVSFGVNATQKNVSWQGDQYVTDMQVTGGEYSFAGESLNVLNNLEIAAGASASFDCKLDIEDTLKTAGNVALKITESQSMNVLASGGSLTKTGSGQLTWVGAEGAPITLDTLTVNDGSFVAESALQAGAVSLADKTSVTLTHSTGNAVLGSVTGAGNATLILDDAGSLQLTNADLNELRIKGNSNVTIDGSVNAAFLSLGKTTVVLESGANVTATRYTSGNTANGQPTLLTINKGAVLNVTGNNQTDNTDSSMLLAHWQSAFSELHLNGGELNVNNTFVLMGWDSGGTLRADSGVANLYGIQFSTQRGKVDAFILGSATEGSAEVNIGAHGIKNIGTEDSVTLGCGTLKATADWETTGAGAITFVSESVGTILDTNGHQVTISSGIDGSGKLLKQGDGTLIIAGSAAEFTGMIDVQEGAMRLSNGSNPVNQVHVCTGGAVQFDEGVTLSNGMSLSGSGGTVLSDLVLNGGSIGAAAAWLNGQNAALTIGSEYTISFADGVTSQLISIDGLMDITAGDYYLVNGQFAAGISADNFTLGTFSDFVNASFTLNETGLWLSVAGVEGGAQIWDGTADAHSWSNELFGPQPNKQQSTVIFTDSAANRQVQIAGDIQAGALIFSNTLDYTVSSTNINYGLTADSIELSNVGKVRISTELDVDSISINKGTLELVGKAQFEQMPTLSMTNGATLQIGDTPVTLGRVSMESGTTIADMGGTGELNITQAMSLAGTLSVGTVNTLANVSFVAGENLHTLNIVAGTTTVHGALSASNINLAADTTLNFADAYTLATGSTISVAGAATLGGDITMAGGTLNFDTALDPGAAALITFDGSLGLVENGSVNIAVKDALRQSQGGTYILATGDFSAFEASNFRLTELSDSLWSFSLNEDKTQLSLTLGAYGIWGGTDAAHSWSNSEFGADPALPSADCVAIFDDTAANKQVQLQESVRLSSLCFDNDADYSIGTTVAATITAESLEKSGTGAVEVGSNLVLSDGVSLTKGTLTFAGESTQVAGDIMLANGVTLNINGNQVKLGKLQSSGANINFSAQKAELIGIVMNSTSTIQFNKADDSQNSVYYLQEGISFSNSSCANNAEVYVAEGTRLNMDSMVSAWGWKNFVIDGEVDVAGTMTLSSGSNDPFTGKGSLSTDHLVLRNIGTYIFDLPQVTVRDSFTINRDGRILSGIFTSEKNTTQGGGSFSIQGGELLLKGIASFNDGSLNLYSGKISAEKSTVNVSNSFTMSGGEISVNGGSMKLSGSNIVLNGGRISITGGGVLDMSAFTFTETAGYTLGATIDIASDGFLSLGNLAANSTYHIFDFANDSATVFNWESLKNNIFVNGVSASRYADVTLEIKDGSALLTIGSTEFTSVCWVGPQTGGVWDTTSAHWDIGSTDTDASNNGTFRFGDNVVFSTDASLSIADSVVVNKLTVENGAVLSTDGKLSIQNTISIGSEATLSIKNAGNMSLNTDLNTDGVLEIASGTTLRNAAHQTDSVIVLNGGDMVLTGSQKLSGDVVIKSGSTLSVGDTNASDHFDYNDGHIITVEEGGLFAIGANRETFGGWTLKLQGGRVTGTGHSGSFGVSALDYHSNGSILAESGQSSIEAIIGVREGKKLTVDVGNGAELSFAADMIGSGNLVKDGAGSLIFTGAQKSYSGSTSITAGSLVLNISGDYMLKNTVSGAGILEVADGTTLKNNGKNISSALVLQSGAQAYIDDASLLTSPSITVESGATLEYAGQYDTFIKNVHTGDGLVKLSLAINNNNWQRTINLGAGFTGETYVQNGNFSLGGSHVGNTLRVADGVNMQSSSSDPVTLAANLVLEGESIIHANYNKDLTYKGSVSGENGIFISNGGGEHIFEGEVNLREFRTNHSGNSNTFKSKTTLNTAKITQATVNFAGDTTITTANISGGTTNILGANVQLTDVNLTGGKLKVSGGKTVISGLLNKGDSNNGLLATVGGEVCLTNSEKQHSVNILDGADGGAASGKLSLAENVKLLVTDTIWGRNGSSIELAKGAAITSTQDSVVFSNRAEYGHAVATLKSVDENGKEYNISDSSFELTNGHLQYTGTSDDTLSTQLTNSSVQNDSEYVLRLDNAKNTLSGVFAESGDIILQNQSTHTLQELKLATELTLSAYKGTSETSENEARITVQKCAEFGVSTTLNADLLMAAGSELKMHGTVSMGSDLTIEAGVMLTGAQYEALGGLINDGVSKVVLFEGIDTLYLGTEAQTTSITLEAQLLASTYFSNLENTDYLLVYDASESGNGILSIMVPEPASSSLSLLALTALAARRRRRK